MTFSHLILAATAALCCAGSASAADPQVAGTAAPAAAKPPVKKTDRVVCRTDDELGSRVVKRKICMTVAQWREVGKQSGDWVEHKSTNLGKPGGG